MKVNNNLKKTRNISNRRLFFSFASAPIKLFAGLPGNSSELLTDTVHSFSELIGESAKLPDLIVTSKPEDWSHNYGHEKIAALFTGAGAFSFLFAGVQSFTIASGEILMFTQGKKTGAPEMFALSTAVLTPVSKRYPIHKRGK